MENVKLDYVHMGLMRTNEIVRISLTAWIAASSEEEARVLFIPCAQSCINGLLLYPDDFTALIEPRPFYQPYAFFARRLSRLNISPAKVLAVVVTEIAKVIPVDKSLLPEKPEYISFLEDKVRMLEEVRQWRERSQGTNGALWNDGEIGPRLDLAVENTMAKIVASLPSKGGR
jgi:hypothetical protein